jgi:hypothetical protein
MEKVGKKNFVKEGTSQATFSRPSPIPTFQNHLLKSNSFLRKATMASNALQRSKMTEKKP